MRRTLLLALLLAAVASCQQAAEETVEASPEPASLSAGDLRRSGTVQLDVSCSEDVQEDFRTAVALLHSFFYEEARRGFEEVAARDASCAMAWWGVAMSYYHPLWSPPTPEEMAAGTEAVRRAKALGGATPIERGLIAAIDAFYRTEDNLPADGPVEQSCHGPRAHGARAAAFRDSLALLREEHPEELEVAAFHALSLLGTAPPTDKAYTNQLQAAAMLESLMERNPDHPGLAHYVIHAYDYPELAARALPAARRFDDIAPWVPHALHMPTHVYTRLGMWDESIEGNLASSAAARAYSAERFEGRAMSDDLHAMDYLMYAYLQSGRLAEAEGVYREVLDIDAFAHDANFATAYAVGAIPARWVMEGERWEEAAALEVPHPELLAGYPFAEAHIAFARAVGAARSGRLDDARAEIARLEALKARLTEPKFQWWTSQIEIQRRAASGWLAHAEGDPAAAEERLRAAAELEETAGTHPVAPGQVLPSREQLGDLLLALGRPGEARAEYEAALAAFPNRARSHAGIARAEERAGGTPLRSR